MAGMMAFAPMALQVAGTAMSAVGYMDAANASKLQAQRRMQATQFAAQQLEQQAGQQTAEGQAGALEARRQGDIVQSNLLARAGASGAGGPGVIDLIKRNAGETAYRSALASYQGLALARQSRLEAAGQIYGGELSKADAEAASNAYRGRAVTTALIGAGSLYDKYFAKPESGWTSGYDLPMGS